jgi:predicted DsbA family dithiol-disulfide isomerase
MHSSQLEISIVSDVVCPWCYIGKRRLEAALQLFADKHPTQLTPTLRWLPFQLNPDMPASGMSRADYLQRKFGSPDGGGIYERVSSEGRKEGLAFDFKSISRQPNTLQPHALIEAAFSLGIQAHMKEALMKAYFCAGADLTAETTLLATAQSAGMPFDTARNVLQDKTTHGAIANQEAEMRRIGISGVPFFIFNRKIGASGAQSAAALLQAMEQA